MDSPTENNINQQTDVSKKLTSNEVMLRDILIAHLRNFGIDVITDQTAGQRILDDYQNGILNNEIRLQSVFHGSGANFDHFDTRHHLSEGEGNQVFGVGTYITAVRKVAEQYANIASLTGNKDKFIAKDLGIKDKIKFFKAANGDAYGFTVNNKIYVDPKIANSETPIHEYAHMWAAVLRAENKQEWDNVVSLMKNQTELWNSVKARYPQLTTDDEIADEVLATYSGKRGSERLREQVSRLMGESVDAESSNMFKTFEEAIKRFWHDVADLFHIHYDSAEQVADQVMSDMLHGMRPSVTEADGVKSSLTDEEADLDRLYAEAVASGNTEEAHQLLVDRAKSKGYLPTDYQGKDSWSAPVAEVEPNDFENKEALQQMVDDFGTEPNIFGIINGIQAHDSDYYYNPDVVGFHGQAAEETAEILRNLRDQQANGDTQINIYRVVPNDVVGSQIMQGDWVALSKAYCDELGNHKYGDGNYHVIESKAPIKNLWMGDEDMREFGFDDGHGDVEKNVRHNRKLLDITFDDKGDLIPLSQRFNEGKDDIRFQMSAHVDINNKSNINNMSEENSTKVDSDTEASQEAEQHHIDDTLDKDAIADGYVNNTEKQWDDIVKMFSQDENLFDQLTAAASGQPLDSVNHTDKFDIIHDFINQYGGKKELGAETETTTGALYNSHSVAQLNLNDGSVLEVNDYSKALADSVNDIQELSHVIDGAIIDNVSKQIGAESQNVNQESLNNLWKAFVGSAPMNRIHEKHIVAEQKKESKEENSKILFDGTREEAWSIVDAIQPYIDDPDITVLLDEWLKATDGYGTPFNTDKEWYKKYAKGKTDHQLVNLYHNAKDFLELVPKEDDKKAVDPIMRVYDQMKAEHPNTILLFKSKSGKFYNSYMEDASTVSEILRLPLQKSDEVKDKDGKFVDNCTFPSHALDTYLPMLVRAGERSVLLDYPPFVEDRIKANKLSEVKQETPHEDSDMRTDVTDTAKHIVASDNVPMEQAEKEAKEIADEQVHKDYHQQQDKLHAEEEKRKQQDQQEQEKKHKVLNSKLYDVFGMKDGKRDIIKSGLTIIAAANFVERNDEFYQRKGYDYLISMPHVEEKLEKVKSETADMAKVQDLQQQQATVRTNSDETEENNQEKDNMDKKEELSKQTNAPSSKEDEKVVNTVAVHAGLLLGALQSAKEGIWLNPHGKHGAALLEPGKMITGYNRLMMDLFADKNHYKTNVFTYYDYAKKEEMPVKQGQTSLPIDWTRWDYENVATKEVITKEQYAELTPDKQQDYARHSTKQTRHLYNIDQTAMAGTKVADYSKLVKDNGFKFEDIPELPTDKNFLNLTNRLHGKHKDCTIILGEGDKNFAYGAHAEKVGSVMGAPVQSKVIDGKKVSYIEFPHNALDTVLPKMIGSHNKVALCSNVLESKFEASNNISKNSVRDAATVADKVSRKAGFTLERVLDDVPVSYDKEKDVLTYSGNNARQPGRENLAAVEKANDIYRAVVEATGRENRLDREARFNMLPEDNAKYEKLVQELSSGVLMAAHGLPAIISKENRELIPYWEREIKENPKMMAVLEKDVNNSIEQIEKHLLGQEVDYAKVRGARPALFDAKDYTVASKMAQLPNVETKEFVVIRNAEKTSADVILPEGASLPGMNKERISHALAKENIKEVHFYNAGGAQGLYKDNDYFAGKTATLTKLKQWELLPRRDVDISSTYLNAEKEPLIERIRVISDDSNKKVFNIKAKGEGQFSVYPAKDYLNAYFKALKNPNQTERSKMLTALAQRYYAVAQAHPESKKEIIMPKIPEDVDMSKLKGTTITRDKEDHSKVYVQSTIDGTFHKVPITMTQYQRMWLADDMQDYKKAIAANAFASIIKSAKIQQETHDDLKIVDSNNVKEVVGHTEKQVQGRSESHTDGEKNDSDKSENEEDVHEAPSKQSDKKESEEEHKSRGFGLH